MNAALMDNIPSFEVPSLEELHTAFDGLLLYYITQFEENLNSFITDSTASENMPAALEHRMLSRENLRSITTEILQNIINIVQITDNLNSFSTGVPHRFTNEL